MLKQGDSKPVKILIAAPNNILMAGIKSVLRADNNYVFDEYLGRADDLLKESKKVNANLLIIDADTPESFGVYTINKLKEKYPRFKIIIVNMLHYLPGKVKSVMQAGADGCISKYEKNSPLAKAVESVLQGGKFLCPLCTAALAESYLMKPSKKAQVKLTEQEKKIVKLLSLEHYNIEIADDLHISLRTVETHRKHIMKKIGARNLAGIVKYAMKNRIIELKIILTVALVNFMEDTLCIFAPAL